MAKEKTVSTRTQSPRYAHIAARVFDTPLLIHHPKLLAILNVLGPRLGFELSTPQLKMMEDDEPPDPFEHMEHLQALSTALEPQGEGHFVGDGVAIIPVTGTLVQRSDWMTDTSGMQSYGRIERMVDAAENDPRVQEVLYEFDTPGGEVAGAFDFADRLYDMRSHGAKPMTAVVNEMAASAGYLLASSTGNVVVNRTGMVGSIGVVAAHFDYSKAMEKRGVVVTFLYRGDKKVDGNPFQPLSDSAKEDWQEDINDVYGLFVDAVTRNVSLPSDKVRGTQAAMYTGFKARDAGLARAVNTFANEFAAAVARVKRTGRLFYGATSRKENGMTKEQLEAQQRAEAEAKAKAEQDAKAKADADAKAKADAEAKAKQEAEAKAKTGAASDRERVKAILGCDEAKGREQMAQHLALETDLTVDQAKGVLAKSPKASKLDEAMQHFNPGVRSEEVSGGAATTIDAPAAMYARRAQIYQGARAK